MIIFAKTIERCHKVSFETICIDVCSFLGCPKGKMRSKQGQIKTENCKKTQFLKLVEVLFIDLRRLCWSKLLMNITNFHLRPFELMIDHFEVSQKQNDVWNRDKLRWKFAKKMTSKLLEALFIYSRWLI